MLDCQGISCGGHQQGLQDPRSALLKHVFKIFDQLPEPQRPGQTVRCAKPIVLCLIFTILSRQFIYLENVKSILSKQKHMMKLMRFLVQALMPWLFNSSVFCLWAGVQRPPADPQLVQRGP